MAFSFKVAMNSDAQAFVALTVLFNVAPSRSSTLQSLARCARTGHHVTCVVWDNSPGQVGSDERTWLRSNLPGSVYRHTPENVGLSRVYNTIIREYLQREAEPTFSALLITDQDSSFGPEFLDQAHAAMASNPDINLFLPHVRAKDEIISPANMYGCIGVRWRREQVGRIRSSFRTAINSGMIVRREYLASRFPGYDERLRFYGTDNDFCRKYSASERWIWVLDAVLEHSLAEDVSEAADVRLRRHRENVRALLVTNGNGWFTRLTSRLYCALYCSKKAIAERNVAFLRWGY